ncbi:hypothetical protein CTI12_AA052860 [Artemisia annua]|uniref:DNA helicase Pif1-like protein n=1 Tax=Artemisia annua TaxID=35608 RepID=A0A2U1QB06_ARTAN|nr:hypothetical protein CTI12_AA052860 [Artemisia annua]
MKEKRQPVPNRNAQDIPIQVSQSLGSEILCNNGVSTWTLVNDLGVSHVDNDGMVPGDSAVVYAGIHSSVAGSSSFCGIIPDLSLRDTSTMEVSHTPAASPVVNCGLCLHVNQRYLLPSTVQSQVELSVTVPVQVPNVDGSVSTFESSSIMHSPYVGARKPGMGEVLSRSILHNNPSAGHTPMVLDFSTGGVTRASYPGASSSNVGVNAPQRGTPVRPTRRAGMRNLRRDRQHTLNGRSCMTDSDDPPVYGPVAPPQRQGAPLDYKCFGRCDQVCQHCGALFWLEERRTGLPMSTAPQYQRCCAGGRAVLCSHDQYPGLIEFLDSNNALVKLFRTVRDKLRETDIPNFSIRLFGVVGGNQYELPTGDGVGAIVYEGGPESKTDYDVVIERHSGEPESVNKLHPAYMALQFPLLYIYGEEGYHLKLRLRNVDGNDEHQEKKMSMKIYYAHQLHDRGVVESWSLITIRRKSVGNTD